MNHSLVHVDFSFAGRVKTSENVTSVVKSHGRNTEKL